MKPRQPIRRVSKKRLAANGGKTPFLKRSAIRKKPRKPSETLRIYGPPARRAFVKSLPCCTCRVEGYTDQAHVAPSSEKGAGYKAGYLWIAPLCGERPLSGSQWEFHDSRWYIGCHALHDEHREDFNARYPDFDPAIESAKVEAAWLAFSGIPERGVQE